MGGKNAGERGPVHAGHLAQHHLRDRHARAGVAGREETVGLAVGCHAGADVHRAALLGAGSFGRVIVHGDPLVGVDHFDRQDLRAGVLVERAAEFRGRSPTSRIRWPSSRAARIAPSTSGTGALSPPIASTAMVTIRSVRILLTPCRFDDLAALVLAAARAHAVRQLRFVAVRAFRMRRACAARRGRGDSGCAHWSVVVSDSALLLLSSFLLNECLSGRSSDRRRDGIRNGIPSHCDSRRKPGKSLYRTRCKPAASEAAAGPALSGYLPAPVRAIGRIPISASPSSIATSSSVSASASTGL